MIPEIGHFALILALALALVQSVLPIWGAARNDGAWMHSAQWSALGQVLFVGTAFAALMTSFVRSDFTVVNVVENSHSLKPMLFKIAGTWGSHEGSLLLWVLILAVFGALVALFAGNVAEHTKARTLSVQAWISVGFLTFMLLTSNPFDRVYPAPIDGQDLNPLLQDVGLAMHPPLLYLGYVGFSIVFSFAVAALIEGRVDVAWARWVRPWTLAAWVFLTAGIALGSWWAYYELGWGGWWFWDPVENVSFMPWLMGTALLHSAIVTEKRGAFKSWTILLAILTFSLSLLGTFIVRSGLLTSVHAFAVDPERGLYILGLLAVSIGGSFSLYAWRAPSMEGGGLFKPFSREGGLLFNNLILATATGTVLFGTLYPLFYEAVTGGQKLSVGPPFFNAAFIPMMLPLVFVMGLGPFLSWKRTSAGDLAGRVKYVGLLAIGFGLVAWYVARGGPVLGYLSLALASWLLLATVREWMLRIRLFDVPLIEAMHRARGLPRAAYGMSLAHAGLAIAIFGFVGSSVWKSEQILFVTPGSNIQIAGFDVTFSGAEQIRGPNYIADRGALVVKRNGQKVTTLYPERRFYPIAQSTTTESAIRSTLAGDLYASLSEPASEQAEAKGAWTLRILYEPLVNFIWLGSALLVVGGLVSLSDRRLRVGAPKNRKLRALPMSAE
ncbi:heme lyase CcmF/NrfE family subunit [Cognatishimia activa]|uniref:heme lyase CcmF/NrfE family subunit n=1 Tax=Cognatishimia activa TaxID=1715691 RepID=UPI00222E3ED5|nr:heme lyase CcmF/NrfE family subunit [Cognatishimia activa]UZD90848.1 heme lyase CcmF/NrfE family subunit [Cognatishimia activa]